VISLGKKVWRMSLGKRIKELGKIGNSFPYVTERPRDQDT
jgi:hypothetical protein